MYTVESDGQQVQVTERKFYERLMWTAEGLEANAERQYRSQQQGFPDLLRDWKPFLTTMAKYSKVVSQIEDKELRDLFSRLLEQTHSFLTEVDDELVAAVANRVGLPFPQTQGKRNQLLREMEDLIDSGIGMQTDEGYRKVLLKAEVALNEIHATKKKIDERLAEHLARLDAS